METDVLIIGGGVAGMAAACEIAALGRRVTLVEQKSKLGGNFRQQIYSQKNLPGEVQGLKGFEIADYYIEKMKSYPIKVLLNHTLIGRYKDGSFGVSDGETVFPIAYSRAIFTTGAAEKSSPFPKWTLPGIMTVGAAQILMNREMVKPGNAAVVVGSDDMALETAIQLKAIGVQIQAVIEKADKMQSENNKLIEVIKETDIPVFLNTEIETAMGRDAVDKVMLRMSGSTKEIDVDLVCTSAGFMPALEPFQLINCELEYEEMLGGWVPVYDENFKLSEEDIYVAGNAAGVTCYSGIILSSVIAGLAAVESIHPNQEVTIRKEETKQLLETFEKMDRIHVWNARKHHIAKVPQSEGGGSKWTVPQSFVDVKK